MSINDLFGNLLESFYKKIDNDLVASKKKKIKALPHKIY